jgi:hypothetical protein
VTDLILPPDVADFIGTLQLACIEAADLYNQSKGIQSRPYTWSQILSVQSKNDSLARRIKRSMKEGIFLKEQDFQLIKKYLLIPHLEYNILFSLDAAFVDYRKFADKIHSSKSRLFATRSFSNNRIQDKFERLLSLENLSRSDFETILKDPIQFHKFAYNTVLLPSYSDEPKISIDNATVIYRAAFNGSFDHILPSDSMEFIHYVNLIARCAAWTCLQSGNIYRFDDFLNLIIPFKDVQSREIAATYHALMGHRERWTRMVYGGPLSSHYDTALAATQLLPSHNTSSALIYDPKNGIARIGSLIELRDTHLRLDDRLPLHGDETVENVIRDLLDAFSNTKYRPWFATVAIRTLIQIAMKEPARAEKLIDEFEPILDDIENKNSEDGIQMLVLIARGLIDQVRRGKNSGTNTFFKRALIIAEERELDNVKSDIIKLISPLQQASSKDN